MVLEASNGGGRESGLREIERVQQEKQTNEEKAAWIEEMKQKEKDVFDGTLQMIFLENQEFIETIGEQFRHQVFDMIDIDWCEIIEA